MAECHSAREAINYPWDQGTHLLELGEDVVRDDRLVLGCDVLLDQLGFLANDEAHELVLRGDLRRREEPRVGSSGGERDALLGDDVIAVVHRLDLLPPAEVQISEELVQELQLGLGGLGLIVAGRHLALDPFGPVHVLGSHGGVGGSEVIIAGLGLGLQLKELPPRVCNLQNLVKHRIELGDGETSVRVDTVL